MPQRFSGKKISICLRHQLQKMRDVEREQKIIGVVHGLADELAEKIVEQGGSEKLAESFKKCYASTAETTMQCYTVSTEKGEREETFLITGDINAMWLRDSSAQVCHYLPFIGEKPELAAMVRGLIVRQFALILDDPYANAFNVEANGRCYEKDDTERDNPLCWERKYELDSLCYPVRLLWQYLNLSGDFSILEDGVADGLRRVLEIMEIEQNHAERSEYHFYRNTWEEECLANHGKGEPVAFTGMIWSGFRPSDDPCKYNYLIPANLFAAEVLDYIARISVAVKDQEMGSTAKRLRREVLDGVRRYGMMKNAAGEEIYAYETDGLGNYVFMDDANVPSLMSIPWITSIPADDPLYLNTRRTVLSPENIFYFEGSCAKGVGSPHTPSDYIWHIALAMQGLTTNDREEKLALLDMLINTDAGTGVMHEGFHKDDPTKYTRDWFAWANSLFSLFVLDCFFLTTPTAEN